MIANETYRLTGDQLLDLVEYTAPGLGESAWSAGDELDAWLSQHGITPENDATRDRARALLEALAAQEHERWSHWMEYMLGCGDTDGDGNWVMPKDKLHRWTRQMYTPYAALSEQEKESDRGEARNTLALLAARRSASDQEGGGR